MILLYIPSSTQDLGDCTGYSSVGIGHGKEYNIDKWKTCALKTAYVLLFLFFGINIVRENHTDAINFCGLMDFFLSLEQRSSNYGHLIKEANRQFYMDFGMFLVLSVVLNSVGVSYFLYYLPKKQKVTSCILSSLSFIFGIFIFTLGRIFFYVFSKN